MVRGFTIDVQVRVLLSLRSTPFGVSPATFLDRKGWDPQ